MWLAKVRETYGDNLDIDWKPFMLAQVNNQEGPEWKAWEQSEDTPTLGLTAFRAGAAAQRQGRKIFEEFQLAMLKARHEDRRDLSDKEAVLEIAENVGLDMAQFREDLADDSVLKDMGESHTEAVEEYGVFGVPTFVFPDGNTAFLKTYNPPEGEAVEMFDEISSVMSKWKWVAEVKRPQPPWPRGVFE